MKSFSFGAVGWALVVTAIGGCSLIVSPGTDELEVRCGDVEVGERSSCACTDGTDGTQECLDSGTFGICECGGAAGDAG